jgi:hypothetical protein
MKRRKTPSPKQRNPVVRALTRQRAGGAGRHRDARKRQQERLASRAMSGREA